MDHTDIIEMAIARLQEISFGWLDQSRLVTLTLLYNAPVGHLRITNRQAVDCPTGTVIVRRAMSSVLVNMSANAKAQLWILVQHLAWAALFGGQVPSNKFLVEQRLRHKFAHQLLAGHPGIRLKGLADVSAQLLKGIGHSLPPLCLQCRFRLAGIIAFEGSRSVGISKPGPNTRETAPTHSGCA